MRMGGRACHTFLAMNTVVTYTAYGRSAKRAAAAAWKETRRLEARLSCFLPGSDIAKLNQAAGQGSVRLSRDAFGALAIGTECSRNTDGCFDMTVGPLVRLWRDGKPPSPEEIGSVRELVDYSVLNMRKRGRTAQLPKAGQSVDLGGIGKGYAADRMLQIFRRHGVCSAFADLGGNVAALGAKPDGAPWTVGIRHPLRGNELIGTLKVVNQSVVTSGDDQRAVACTDGTRISHIVDPRTGMPVQSGLLSVTVVSDSSAVADALATALFTAGMAEGVRILARYPGTQAVFIDQDVSVYLTAGLAHRFQAAQGILTTVLKGDYS